MGGYRYTLALPFSNYTFIYSDDYFRTRALWLMKKWLSDSKNDWEDKVPVFLKEVWPRQKNVKSSRVSASLCELLFSNVTIFPKIIDIVLSLVGKIKQGSFGLPQQRYSNNDIIDKYPGKVLEILLIVLSEDLSRWPHGIEDTLEQIGTSEPTLLNDSRLIELKRRWNSR